MNDCYRILGVGRQASASEIRGAYLAKMKALHPDARRDGNSAGGEASEISFAYWQLRDVGRRAEHDRALFGDPAPRAARRSVARNRRRRAMPAPPAPRLAEAGRRPKRSRRLQPLRTAAGVAACLVAGMGFALAYSYFDPPVEAQAQAAFAGTGARLDTRAQVQPVRRNLDPALATAAAESFREVVRRSGLQGVRDYARQCLLELAARPTMSMLDYCVAFEDHAAGWEVTGREAGDDGRRYFAEAQRFGRYHSIAHGLKAGKVREAIRADVAYFAVSRR